MMAIQANISDILEVNRLLKIAGRAARAGERERAYHLSLQATQMAPWEAGAWLLRAELAPSIEETIACLNRANDLNPHDRHGQWKTFQTLHRLLHRDPYLVYLDETEHLYRVANREYLTLNVPKKRSIQEPNPLKHPTPLKKANGWLALASLGLFFGGIGSLIFAPIAIFAVADANRRPLNDPDHIRSVLIVITAGGLFGCGLILSVLFLLHLI